MVNFLFILFLYAPMPLCKQTGVVQERIVFREV